MTRTTNFKRLLCCILTLLILFVCIFRPMVVYADPVTASIVGIGLPCVIGAILIALGVGPSENTSAAGFNSLVNDIVTHIPTEFVVLNTTIGTVAKMILSDGITYAPRNLLEWVIDYLVTPADAPVIPTDAPIVPAVEAVFKPPEMSGFPYSTFFDFVVNRGSALDAAFVTAINKMSRCVLMRMTLYDASDSSSFASYGYLWCNNLPSFSAVSGITINGKYCERAVRVASDAEYVIAYSRSGLADGNLVRIHAGSDYEPYLENVSSVRLANPVGRSAYTASDSDSIALTDFFSDSLENAAHSAWLARKITVSDSLIGTGVVGLPLSVPATVADAADRSYTDTISGTKTVAETVSLTDTDVGTDTGTDTGTASLWGTLWGWLEKIWTAIKSLVTGITAPIVSAVSAVRSEAVAISEYLTGTTYVESPLVAIHFGDLFNLFPFNIPYGIYNAITFWNAQASPPVITIPLPTYTGGGFDIYEFEINFSEIPGMDTLASIIRGGELILFAIGLLIITRKVTKW